MKHGAQLKVSSPWFLWTLVLDKLSWIIFLLLLLKITDIFLKIKINLKWHLIRRHNSLWNRIYDLRTTSRIFINKGFHWGGETEFNLRNQKIHCKIQFSSLWNCLSEVHAQLNLKPAQVQWVVFPQNAPKQSSNWCKHRKVLLTLFDPKK